MKTKGLFILILIVSFSSMLWGLSPIQVTVVNESDKEVAINYKYDGKWAYPYSDTIWDMLWEGSDDLNWFEMKPGMRAVVLIDMTGILRVVERNVHNGKWYSKIGFPLQAWWEGQVLTIK